MPTPITHENLTTASIAEVVSYLDSHEADDAMLAALRADSRTGVQALADRIERKRAREANEQARLERLAAMELALIADGYATVAGIDEAGRGPLAGPVVAAAAVLPADCHIPGLDDSKKLTAKKRETLYEIITAEAVAWGIGMAGHDIIDAAGILEAAMGAMRDAVANLHLTPAIALVDGNRSPRLACEERLIVNGDGRCRAIAAASVIAKVTRDRLMIELDSRYPGYGFAGHKGYGAATHIEAIRRLGPSDIHRMSFRIVPEVSPPGTCETVLERRITAAFTPLALEHAAAAVKKTRDYLSPDEIARLRECYRQARSRLNAREQTP